MDQILQIGLRVKFGNMITDGVHTETECTVVDIFRSLETDRIFLEVEYQNEDGEAERKILPLITK